VSVKIIQDSLSKVKPIKIQNNLHLRLSDFVHSCSMFAFLLNES